MHGIIFAELEKYVDTTLGPTIWPDILRAAGLPPKIYMPVSTYPDAEFELLLQATAQKEGTDVLDFMSTLGEATVPGLLSVYGAMIDPTWRTLEIVEQAGNVMHSVVKIHEPLAKRPEIVCVRTSLTALTLTYHSERQMCRFAMGIVRGLGRRFAERITIEEDTCMLLGDLRCTMRITAVGGRRSSTSMQAVKT